MSDAELMLRIQRDDAEALGALFERYGARAYGLARAMCRQPDIADDIVQEAFISIWRSRSTYSAKGGVVGAWTMGIVRNRAIDNHRRNRRHDRHHADAFLLDRVAEAADLAHDACTDDENQRLRDLIGRLPGAQRDVIALAYYSELTHAEIAALLDIPLGTVKGRMRLGLRKLREHLLAA